MTLIGKLRVFKRKKNLRNTSNQIIANGNLPVDDNVWMYQ